MLKKPILVVDDDLEILRFYRKIFSASSSAELDILGRAAAESAVPGISCLAYSDPKTLVADYRRFVEAGEHHPLCIVDMRMPQQNGLVTAVQLREIDPDIDIVISTAAGDFTPGEVRDKLQQRVFFVRKPFDAAEFSLMIRSLVDYWEDRQRLRRQTAFLRSLLESVPELIFMKDTNGVYMMCNDAFARFARRRVDEIVGRADSSFVSPEKMLGYFEQDREVMQTAGSLTFKERVEHPDGGQCVLETVKSPVFSKSGECIGLIGISRDITNRPDAVATDDVGL